MYDVYCSDAPSGLVVDFCIYSCEVLVTFYSEEVYCVWNALYLCFVLRMNFLNQNKTTVAQPNL